MSPLEKTLKTWRDVTLGTQHGWPDHSVALSDTSQVHATACKSAMAPDLPTETTNATWWWERSWFVGSAIDGRVSDEAKKKEERAHTVRSYWDVDVLNTDSKEFNRRNGAESELHEENEFPTEELDEDELAELGRVLLRAGEGVEARARATRQFFATRQPKTRAVIEERPKAKPGTTAWIAKLAAKRDELFRDKKNLATRQAKRASFLTSESASLTEARHRERLNKHRLDDIKSMRRQSPGASVSRSSASRDLNESKRKSGAAFSRGKSHHDSLGNTHDDIETRAAVDIYWKQSH